ncbi:MAG: glutamine--fructose-6-phosphate transaminase (isomerizing) [Lentisphaeraceae bacterium]|nr:glutamine--fructose-6-phosphate transaminase (isomerizing) [Lentisphaeraceae bacterium]
MCGIIAYLGKRPASEVLVTGLHRLEYRGYDSSGLTVLDDGKLETLRAVGKVANLRAKVSTEWEDHSAGKVGVGIAHTRWATHGEPTEENAHPHVDVSGKISLVHNGIIENYLELKNQLISRGCTFQSDTDSEVFCNLISELYEGNLEEAVLAAMRVVEGTFGIVAISADEPGKMITARRGSPIVIGVGNGETLVASDVSALVQYTRQVIYLDDNDIACIDENGVTDIFDSRKSPVSRATEKVEWDLKDAEKDGYDHYMLKEVFEQPQSLKNTFRGRLDHENGTAILSGLNLAPREIVDISRISLFACGTSLHAAMLGQYFFEDLAQIPAQISHAAEFRYRNPIVERNTYAIAISQSGETADTLAAVREAKRKGANVVSLCNVVGSTIARETGRGVYLHAGPEVSVASTKAFTSQVMVLLQMALKFARCSQMSREVGIKLCKEIEEMPNLVQQVLDSAEDIKKVALKFKDYDNCFFIGRGYMYPVALEGALKLKEISYIHAEGYHAAELKHGPIALLQDNVPVIAMANDISGQDKVLGNVAECMARKSPVLLIATEGDEKVKQVCDNIIWVPKASEPIAALLTSVALQLYAYYIAVARDCSVDQPRNLAKSVTVE